jgi:hypothetical protein
MDTNFLARLHALQVKARRLIDESRCLLVFAREVRRPPDQQGREGPPAFQAERNPLGGRGLHD